MAQENSSYYLQIKDKKLDEHTYLKGSLFKTDNNEISIFRTGAITHEPLHHRLTPEFFQDGVTQTLTKIDFQLLLAINDEETRYAVYTNEEWMEEGRQMRCGDNVFILKFYNDNKVPGIIRYVGQIYEPREDIYFGIELHSNYAGQGTTDGFFRLRRFECKPNCGVFCNLARIRRIRNNETATTNLKDLEQHVALSVDWTSDELPKTKNILTEQKLPVVDPLQSFKSLSIFHEIHDPEEGSSLVKISEKNFPDIVEWRKCEQELMDDPTLHHQYGSLSDDDVLENLIHILSALRYEHKKRSDKITWDVTDVMHDYLISKTKIWTKKDFINLSKNIDKLNNPDIKDEKSILMRSVKFFRACLGRKIGFTKVTPPNTYVKLQGLLDNCESINLFSDHIGPLLIVSVEETLQKNFVVPSLTLDLMTVYLSCRNCKEILHCPNCYKPKENIASVCKKCYEKYKSLRLSIFCDNCFDVSHQKDLAHLKEQLKIKEFQEKNLIPCILHDYSGLDILQPKEMKLFGIMSSIKGKMKAFVKHPTEAEWFEAGCKDDDVQVCVPQFANFFQNYMTSPFTSFDPYLHEIMDGLKVCYYQEI